MRAAQLERAGLDGLRVVPRPDPVPRDGEVLVDVVASSINPVDVKTIGGTFGVPREDAPLSPGWDVAGVVVDANGTDLRVGTRVIGMSHQLSSGTGTWAERVALPRPALAPAPRSIGLVEAATLPLAGLTALQSLAELALEPGQRLLVAGGSGAVGAIAVQAAQARGVAVEVLVTARHRARLASALGETATHTHVRAIPTATYDAVLDTYGAFVVDAVVDHGTYLSIATEAGPPPASPRPVRVVRHQVQNDQNDLRELAELADRSVITTRLDSLWPLSDVRGAVSHVQAGGLDGKAVLVT